MRSYVHMYEQHECCRVPTYTAVSLHGSNSQVKQSCSSMSLKLSCYAENLDKKAKALY